MLSVVGLWISLWILRWVMFFHSLYAMNRMDEITPCSAIMGIATVQKCMAFYPKWKALDPTANANQLWLFANNMEKVHDRNTTTAIMMWNPLMNRGLVFIGERGRGIGNTSDWIQPYACVIMKIQFQIKYTRIVRSSCSHKAPLKPPEVLTIPPPSYVHPAL